VAASVAAGSPTAAAAESAADEAEMRIQRGIQLRKSEDDMAALPEFQKAYELAPGPRAAGQLGLSEQALGLWDLAELHLTECLRATGDAWVEKHRQALEDALKTVRGHVGAVEIRGEPVGAEVHVNGRKVGELPLPRDGLVRVSEGDADIELRATGYERSIQKVRIRPYQVERLVVRLQKLDPVPSSSPATPPPEPFVPPPLPARPETPPPAPPPPPSPVAVSEHPPLWRRPLVGWLLAGGGVAVMGVGLGVALAGQSTIDDAVEQAKRANMTSDEPLYSDAARQADEGRSTRTVGRVLIGVGGAVVTSGVVLLITNWRRKDSSVGRLEPWLDTDRRALASGGLLWSGRW
jgi:hypothetical protein